MLSRIYLIPNLVYAQPGRRLRRLAPSHLRCDFASSKAPEARVRASSAMLSPLQAVPKGKQPAIGPFFRCPLEIPPK